MPIYAYRCNACGFAKDVLQKMSDPVLTVCPECNKPEFKKQVTSAGFQLKGSGWYVTDFKGGSGGTSTAVTEAKKNESGSTTTPAAPATTATTTTSDSGSNASSTKTIPSTPTK